MPEDSQYSSKPTDQNLLKVKIKKLEKHAVIPTGQDFGNAGIDLTAIDYRYDHDNKYHEYGTGLALEIPPGYVGLIFPRSSISNTNMSLANSVGVIDSSYRGEVTFRFRELFDSDGKQYEVGDRIGQLIIISFPRIELEEVGELTDTKRGRGGYGSTGR